MKIKNSGESDILERSFLTNIILLIPFFLLFVDYGIGRTINFSPLKFLLFLCTLIWFIMYLRKKISFHPTILFWSFLFLISADVLSVINATVPFEVLRGTLFHLLLIIEFYLVVTAMSSKSLIQKMIKRIMVAVFLATAYGILQAVVYKLQLNFKNFLDRLYNVFPVRAGLVSMEEISNIQLRWYRVKSFFWDPNAFAVFLICFLFLHLGSFLYYIVNEPKKKLTQVLLFISIFSQFICLILTLSRNAWLGIFAGGIIFFFLQSKLFLNRKVWIAFLIMALIMLVIDLSGLRLYELVVKRIMHTSVSADVLHLTSPLAGLDAFRRHPVFGIGLLNFKYFYQSFYNPSKPFWITHSLFVNFFAETGILGGVANLLIIFFIIKYTFTVLGKLRQDSKGGYWYSILVGFFAGFVAVLSANIFGQDYSYNVWFLMGMNMATARVLDICDKNIGHE